MLSDSRLYPFLATVGIDTAVTKGWFRVELQNRRTGAPLRLCNLHAQADIDIIGTWPVIRARTDAIRIQQAAQMGRTLARAAPMPTVVAGDWNSVDCWLPGARDLGPRPGPDAIDYAVAWGPVSPMLHSAGSPRCARVPPGWSDHAPVIYRFSPSPAPSLSSEE